MWSSIRRILLLAAICAAPSGTAAAQVSHADMLGEMAERCLAPVVAPTDSFRVAFDDVPGFLETHLLRAWIAEDRTVLSGDADVKTHLLTLTVGEAGVDLDRASGGMLERTARLALAYRFTSPSATVLGADTCRRTERDAIRLSDARSLADASHAGTSPDIPATSRLRRIVEPVVVIGAAAVGTYLFFNLRSRRSDN